MDISKIDIEQLVKYINIELRKNENLSVNKLCDKLDIKRSTLKSRLSKEHYNFNIDSRRYVKNDNNHTQVTTDVIQEVAFDKVDNNDKGMNLIIDDKLKDNLINLAQNYDRIMQVIEGYDKKYDNGITIELPIETIKDFRTTIRVNNVVWEQFKKFSKEHNEFTQRDLLSQALLNYINK